MSSGCLIGSLECFHRMSLLLLPRDLRVPLNVLLGGGLFNKETDMNIKHYLTAVLSRASLVQPFSMSKIGNIWGFHLQRQRIWNTGYKVKILLICMGPLSFLIHQSYSRSIIEISSEPICHIIKFNGSKS